MRSVSLLQPVSEPELNGIAEIRVAETRRPGAHGAQPAHRYPVAGRADGRRRAAAGMAGGKCRVAAAGPAQRGGAGTRTGRSAAAAAGQRAARAAPAGGRAQRLHRTPARPVRTPARFIADASHELRTPLAALKARIELGLRDADPAAGAAPLEDAGQSTDKVIHRQSAAFPARIESGAQSIAEVARSAWTSQLARELGLAMAALAHKRGVALATEAEAPVWIDGEPTLISELLSNLLDNAPAHTLGGGNVVLRVLDGAVLEVEDDGGIPVAERDRVFAPLLSPRHQRPWRRPGSGHRRRDRPRPPRRDQPRSGCAGRAAGAGALHTG